MTPSKRSLASLLRAKPEAERIKILKQLGVAKASALRYAWPFWARPEQLAPGTRGAALDRTDWSYWLLLAGRGFGKTRAGAEFSIEKARSLPGSHGALVAATGDDARKTMVSAGLETAGGVSGILAVSPPDFMPIFEPSKRTLTWPNGSVATLYSAEEPDRLRGPQHAWAWVDEIAAWEKEAEAWNQLLFGLRLGARPQVCITTTPRPLKIVRELLADPRTVVTRGSTFDNAENLAPAYVDSIRARFEGTRLGRQELYAEVLDDVEGALWNHALIDRHRVKARPSALRRVVVAVDPSGSAKKDADETGIVVAAAADCSCAGPLERHAFVLEDLSGRFSPSDMGGIAVAAYHRHGADRLVAETNFGGELIQDLIRLIDPRVAYRGVHASRGKIVRAEPIAALYERGRVHHVGMFTRLEDELCSYTPMDPKSPGRLDALVWALSDLALTEPPASFGDLPFKSPRRIFSDGPSYGGGGDDDDDDDWGVTAGARVMPIRLR